MERSEPVPVRNHTEYHTGYYSVAQVSAVRQDFRAWWRGQRCARSSTSTEMGAVPGPEALYEKTDVVPRGSQTTAAGNDRQ